ncbi:hypothetical protein [Allofrancisella frigidaquae]|uniref:Uncharacterized protein n=1 Tax=Allofrancisella frigidaquae TaxID=1085644 RepID=A0A6M3HVP8_9GAMM|nr:hypothetical protein [Allofrancisella frigidaquae]QIV93856.1 hypothetical protein E3E15_00160 [Allofrancisella frigidaquae]
MKKTFFLSLASITITTLSFADTSINQPNINIVSDSSVIATKQISKDYLPTPESVNGTKILKASQPTQSSHLVGSNPATWTPAYLSVKNFKNCLKTQKYRGWEGYCMPEQQSKDCPNESWEKLKQMNLVPCIKDKD